MDDFELHIVQETASPEGGPVHRGEKGKCQKNVNRRRFKVKNRGKNDINAVKMPAVIGLAPTKGDKKARKRPRPEDGQSKPGGAAQAKQEDKADKRPKVVASATSPSAGHQQQEPAASINPNAGTSAATTVKPSPISKPATAGPAAGKPTNPSRLASENKPQSSPKSPAPKAATAVKPAAVSRPASSNGHAKANGASKANGTSKLEAAKVARPAAPQSRGQGAKAQDSSDEDDESSEEERRPAAKPASKQVESSTFIIPRLDPTKLAPPQATQQKKAPPTKAAPPARQQQQKIVGNARQRPVAPARRTSEEPEEYEEEPVEMEESESSEEDSDAEEDEDEDEKEEEEGKSGVKPGRKRAVVTPPAKHTSDKPTRKTLTQVPAGAEKLAEFHARPSLLSEAAASQPAAPSTSRHLFTTAKIESLELHPHLVSLLKSPREHMGFGLRHCTKVQSASIPRLMTGQNALLSSETGSGKTLAYLLPLLQQLQAVEPRPQRSDGTLALVLAPTRELCHQIHDVLARLVKAFIWLVPGVITGGEKRKSEKARLRKGITIVVATPGRLLDHLQNTECFQHKQLSWLVLDEADRLMDLGFETQVRDIYQHLSEARASCARPLQVITATATVTSAVDRLGRGLMGRHVRIDANKQKVTQVEEGEAEGESGGEEGGSGEEVDGARADREKAAERAREKADASASFVIPKQLVQQFMVVTCKLRLPALVSFLRTHGKGCKSVVFASTCDSVDFHHQLFKEAKWIESDDEPLLGPSLPVYRLHGNIPQAERLQTFRAFSAAKVGVLLCTDVAARGLDLPAVDWILQYDPPNETAEYVHRVGRTARKGMKGSALLFLLPSEKGYLDNLRAHRLEPLPLSLQSTLTAATPKRFAKFRAPEEVYALEVQQALESCVEGDEALLGLGRTAFQSFVRAYSTHSKELKPFFNVRSLHLGHVARSFALRVAPSSIKVNGVKTSLPSSGGQKSSSPGPDSRPNKSRMGGAGRRKVVLGVRPPRGAEDEDSRVLGKRKDAPDEAAGSKRLEGKRKRAIVHQARKAVIDEFAA